MLMLSSDATLHLVAVHHHSNEVCFQVQWSQVKVGAGLISIAATVGVGEQHRYMMPESNLGEKDALSVDMLI